MGDDSKAMTTDGFDLAAQDPTASPIRGISWKFKDGDYFSRSEKVSTHGQAYIVLDRRAGWQKLAEGVPPEYLMQEAGKPKPPQPHVDKEDWPPDLNGKPAHPWKWVHYLYLLNEKTGEISTFWTDTIGGNIAIGELSDQVSFMRGMQPGAMPVVALQSKDMPTQYGGTTPRPHFQIMRWKMRDAAVSPQAIAGPQDQLRTVEEPSLKEKMGGDEVPFSDSPDIDTPKAPPDKTALTANLRKSAEPEKPHTTKRGVTKIAGGRGR
jgi:hypothetical protein